MAYRDELAAAIARAEAAEREVEKLKARVAELESDNASSEVGPGWDEYWPMIADRLEIDGRYWTVFKVDRNNKTVSVVANEPNGCDTAEYKRVGSTWKKVSKTKVF